MSLRLVYGRAGSGKTRFCLDSIKSSLNSDEQNPIILIVPEQFSLQAEKSLIKAAPKGGVMRAEVLSFRRMAYRVFNEVGGIARRHINNAGKNMILFRIMDRLREQLGVFAGAAGQKGFAAEISRMIAEFKRYDVTPEMLKRTVSILKEEAGSLRYKLEDLSLIYSEFEALIRDKYLDTDDDLTELYKKLDSSGRFNDAEIWIDEFSGFTPQEYKIIQKLLQKSRRVNICLCTDCLETETGCNPGMVFAPVRNTASKLQRLASQVNIRIEKPVKLEPQKSGGYPPAYRFASNRELGHLEQNLYRYPSQVYAGPCESLSVFAAANMFSEAEACARDVISLCRDGGLRYRDIAVTCRNLDNYEKLVSVIFNEYGIPFFIDRKRDITGHPLVVLILSALEIFTANWSYETVFRYIKSGLSNVERDSADKLENYVLACGIRGSRWTQDGLWTARTGPGSGARGGDYEKQCMEEINNARTLLVAPLTVFRSKTRGKRKAVEICTAIYELLLDIGVPERMESLIQGFSASGELEKANEYRQVWNIAMEVLNQVVEVAGEEGLSLRRFSDILSAGFEEYNVGLIPPALDQVLVGSVERSKSHEIKALFVLGVNDGVFPAAVNEEGMLSDAERIRLAGLGVELARDSGYRLLEERFLEYSSLASPSRFLRLSYPAADANGRALRPSRLLADIKRIFPDMREASDITGNKPEENPMEYVAAPMPAFNGLVSAFRRDRDGLGASGVWKDVYRWFQNNEDWKGRSDNILAGITYSNRAGRLDNGLAQRLYGSPVHTSISRLESFAACPFSYYARYGLKAEERKIFRLEPVDTGTFMHNVLDEFSRLLADRNISWRTLEAEWCREQVSMIVDGILQKTSGTIFNSSKRYVYLSGRLKRIVAKAVLVIAEHMKRSGFEPVEYEVEFAEGGKYPPIVLELPSGERLSLTGRIDRIDRMANEDGAYLRIIDYKSGNKALKLSDVFYGLQLQLLTYMDAVLGDGSGEKLLPGGVLYFRLDDPIVRGERQSSEEEIEKAIMKQLKMKGLLLADVKVVKEMDRQIDGESLIIPARLNKGDVLGRSSTATMEQFQVLRNYVRKTLAAIGTEIVNGNVAISPYKKRTGTACGYCSYSAVCQFDTAFSDNSYRFLNDIKDEDVWHRMDGDAGNTGKGGPDL